MMRAASLRHRTVNAMTFDRAEVEQAVLEYQTAMMRGRRGETSFDPVAEFYTDDAIYEEATVGRIVGRDAIVDSFNAGAEWMKGWQFPPQWTAIGGDRAVYAWTTVLPAQRRDGSNYEGAEGVTILMYAGAGKFSYHKDLYDRMELHALLADAGLTT
jgi:ketosteroid isomerase-like protein